MPDPLPRLLSTLRAATPELDGTALAEALWLAAHMAGAGTRDGAGTGVPDAAAPRTAADPSPGTGPERPDAAAHPGTPPTAEPGTGRTRPPRADGSRPADGTTTRPLHERLPGSAAPLRGHAVAAPQAAGLPRALELTRALRPWKRRWPQGRRSTLDIDATVDGYARSGELIPVFQPAPERWFDLVLVVDRSPGMRVWDETVADFTAVLDRLGAFRTLQLADLAFDASGRPRAPGALRSADGRRLVVVVSDCMADAWRRPDVWHLLRDWAGTHPTAVLNPLPTKLWRRGGLDLPTTRFTPAAPGSGRSRVRVTPPLLAGPPDPSATAAPGNGAWLPVPVLSLTPHSLDRWSRTLMRGDPEGCTAVLVPPTGRTAARAARPRAVPLPPAELARRFLRTASPRAARLAVLCAPFDRFSLRLLHLVREKLVPEAGVADIAEVVTSGVFQVVQDGGTVELVLPPDAQQALRAHLPADQVWALHQALDQHLAHRGTGRTRLPSVAHDEAGPHEIAAEREAFARASRRTLELLGLAEPQTGSGDADPGEAGPELPPGPEPYIGRPELDTLLLQSLTTGARILGVTAAGVPGAGRTALALRLAHSVRDRFPDGVVFLPLHGSTPRPVAAEAAMDRLLRELGLPAEDSPRGHTDRAALTEALHRALEGRRVLLVLDDLGSDDTVRALLGPPPEGCAVLVTARHAGGYPPGATIVDLPPLTGPDAARLFAASGAPRPEAVARGSWWPITLRILGGAVASADPVVSAEAARIVAEGRVADRPLSPAVVVRRWLDELSQGRVTTLLRLAEVTAAEFALEEAAAVLDREPQATAAHLDTLVRDGLLERPGPERYVFPAVVRAEVAATPGYDERRDIARALIGRFRRGAAASFHQERHPASGLAERLRVPPEPAPRSEVWVRNALESADVDADILLLLRDAGATPPYRAAFAAAAERLIAIDPRYAGPARGRAALALAQVQHLLGRHDDAWETLHRVGPDRLRDDEATYATAALLLARLALARRPVDGARTAVSWAMEAWSHTGVLSPEAGDVLLSLEQAFTASDEHQELLWVQEQLVAHAARSGQPVEEARARVRLAATLLRNGRAREVGDTVRPALELLDPARDAADLAEAERLLRAAASPERVLVALKGLTAARRGTSAAVAALLARMPAVGQGRFASHVFEDCVLLLVDGAVPLGPLLQGLVEWLPATRIAVHRGVVSEVPAADTAVTYTRAMLRSADFVRTSENYPDDTTLCVSPEVYEALTRDTADSELTLRFVPRQVRTEDGTAVCVILTPRLDLSAWDPELLALARVFNELDPQGRRMTALLRAALDAELGRGGFVRTEETGVREELAKRLSEQTFPFRLGRAADLTWERPGRAVPLDIRVSLQAQRWDLDACEAGRLCLLVYADDTRSRWSAGIVRGGGTRPWFGSVLWLHRDVPLPENVLLGLDHEARTAVLAPGDPVARVTEFFHRVRMRAVPAIALRPLVGERDWERGRERLVRLAGGALRAEGLLLLAGNARGRALAEALRLPVPAGDAYVCAPLVRRTSGHGSRPAVTVEDTTWVVAREGERLAPLPTGFPSLRTR